MSWSTKGYNTDFQAKRTYHSKGGRVSEITPPERPPMEDPRRRTIRRMLQGSNTREERDHWMGMLNKFDQENPTS